ncbi:hypothetical protein GOBAR_AA23500 [Gossypium barbadense]|uniref:tRNA (adenine(58)-N(1))-methyltransferase n=1 Tax=Gossypium barbadense TaxID=3634 RepID=A0A2P5X1D3_GOSBA|nr:hypothetical protein GOBAR_AA23500 [Gossypium barbadense]
MGISIDNGDALFLFIYIYILTNAGLPGILGDSLFLMELWKLHISPTSSVSSIECVFRLLKILLIDSSMKIPFNRCIRDGDFFIVYERHDTMKAVKVNRGGFVYLLASIPELWTLVLSHRTQILYIADISFVIMYLEAVPGCLVLESGTGSGSLTTSFARAVTPTGHGCFIIFHSFNREDFERTGISTLVTMGVRDIQGEVFPDQFYGLADSIFLDLLEPWLAIPSA